MGTRSSFSSRSSSLAFLGGGGWAFGGVGLCLRDSGRALDCSIIPLFFCFVFFFFFIPASSGEHVGKTGADLTLWAAMLVIIFFW